MTFTHGSYTVAWICALPLELAATKAILDEFHPTLPQPKSDHNVYTLGSVSGHNVVVVCLPAGIYGTTAASAAVSHLTSTYPNVRFGLMVGIGGGVPRENPDIRLGDIVVSKPTNTSSGVIQYDYGKTIQSKQFHYTGSLNKPPLVLLKAIAQMESDHMLGKAALSKIMASNQKEEVYKQFRRPSTDQLFRSAYSHVGDRPDCAMCDQSQLVSRPERGAEEPYIHYGMVASGNQVMKDAGARDRISQELDILCFEMEAAGLMDEIPSLVIRGICDYCDSHKHKEWQPYAAFVAAAYAKAVLMQVPQEHANIKESVPEKRHWMVPFHRNLGFVGREDELVKIEELIKVGQPKIAICGLGGVGKTQIAIELAHRIRKRDPTCSIFWIPCTSYANIEQAYMGITQTLGMQGIKPAEVKEHVRAYFTQIRDHRWLLIFDNADDMDMWFGAGSIATALTDILPQSEQGCILFTTRNRKLAVKFALSAVVNVSEPDAETGVKILEKTLIRQDLLLDKEATIALLQQLLFLPLAITQAAAYINSNDIKLSDYTALLQEQESDVIELLSENFEDQGRYKEIQNPVATTWLISFQQIHQLNPLAVEYLSFMACISPRDIPQSLIPEADSKKRKIDAVGLLRAFSFVSEQGEDHALNLHRLVYLSTRNWLRKQGQFSLHIQKAADHFSQVFPDADHKNQKMWRLYLPHALSLVSETVFKREQRKYINMMRNIGRCLRADGRYNEAAILFEDIVKLQKREKTNVDELALTSMADLGWTYNEQGRFKEAEELEEEVLKIRKRVLGPDHPDTLFSMANLACTYGNQGRFKEAEELEEEVLKIRKRVLGPDHPDTLFSTANLACTYGNQGRYKEAEELEEEVLKIRKRVLGPDHPDTLRSMANLACTYRNQGRLKEAEGLGVEVLNIRKRVLGPDHPDTLSSMDNLAHTWRFQQRIHDALALMEQCLELRSRVLGPSHPDSVSSSRVLKEWNEGTNLSSDRNAPTVVVTKSPCEDEKCTALNRSCRHSASSIRQFLESHPLLIASRSSSPKPGGHNLHEVD
ncbi:purine and uridine phosphorylase [Aspergillus granulosus]|uniref:Purine and uridine phosphorylase n=1 Tax=Aspergillus granulosus TaxID=176169 RepID=A0ABR4H133_9EURO